MEDEEVFEAVEALAWEVVRFARIKAQEAALIDEGDMRFYEQLLDIL